VRDIIKSTTAGQLNNVYICIANSVIGDTLTDTDHFALLVDAYSAASLLQLPQHQQLMQKLHKLLQKPHKQLPN